MMLTNDGEPTGTLTVLLGEDVNPAGLLPLEPSSSRIHLLSDCDLPEAAAARKLFVFTPASRLGDLAPCISEASRHNRLQALLVRTDVEAEWVPFMLRRAGLRTLRNLLVHSDAGLPGRMLRAWALGVQRDAIAAATTWDDRLLVVTCAFEEFEISFGTYPALGRIPAAERPRFQVEDDGMFLEWPRARVHLTVEDLRLATDPALRARAQARRRVHDQGFGAAVRALRESRGIAQARVAGLSARHLRRIENGYVPGDEAIEALAAAHGMGPDAYLDAVAERMVVP
ncbi:helix-turn-helix transcriptional regulator [Longimicrobium sp.]|uniref:helix-turn-helix domain-containing protein n=1 Tax=Longimicrobium sp. TaxID=2029185 RepID=UPI002E3265DB|nr:helix-turn-helix transcriptional regulator [Longimicrobium sp.]HEX6042762.1 helix-turn-helix transcriptional regulator [Longimicrobium sp.]